MKLALVTSPSNSSTAECSPTLDLLRGHPSTSLLPTAAVYEAASVALNSPSLLPHDSYAETRHPLHYGPDKGNLIVREEIGRWTAERYRLKQAVAPDHLYLTNGASYGLQIALSLFTSPGTGYTKRAFIVSPTYFLASRTFEDAGFADKMIAIKSTETSIDFDALLQHLQRVENEIPDVSLEDGLKPILRSGAKKEQKRIYKYVMYGVPTYSNPTGETWDLETRTRVVDIAREWDILVITDDVYDLLGNDDQKEPLYPRLVTLDAGTLQNPISTCNTLSNCSFSKLVGPGIRVGWLESASSVLAKQLGDGGANHSGGCPCQFQSAILYPLLLPVSPRNPLRKIDTIISTLTAAYTSRCRVLIDAIEEYLPENTEIWGGRGGFFIWIGLPDSINAKEVVALAAAKEGVIVASGEMSECSGEGNKMGWGDKWIRIAVSYCDGDELVEGVKRLGRALERWNAGERVEGDEGPVIK
ncbi:pyridoxal phosphate-dependent transferase [Trichophaea hybrida]|nr:pyridoxal phosphate-dependent transferase [Trichophaea hybrida]